MIQITENRAKEDGKEEAIMLKLFYASCTAAVTRVEPGATVSVVLKVVPSQIPVS